MDEKARQDVIDSLRRKILNLHRLAYLLARIHDIDEGTEISYLGNAIGKLTEDMIDTLDTLEESGEDE